MRVRPHACVLSNSFPPLFIERSRSFFILNTFGCKNDSIYIFKKEKKTIKEHSLCLQKNTTKCREPLMLFSRQ